MNRKQKLDQALDALEEEIKNTPLSVRLEIDEYDSKPYKYTLMGGVRFNPKYLYFKELPTFIEEKLAILKMLNDYQEIPTLGKKFSENTYHIYMSPAVWESLIPTAHLTKTPYQGETDANTSTKTTT